MIQKEVDAEFMNPDYDGTTLPNFMIWGWMTSILHLSKQDLLLFAYLYAQSHDNIHYLSTCPTVIAEWFGMTRQTVIKHIESLPCVEKLVSKEHTKGSYTFTYYRINMNELLKLVVCTDTYDYANFMKAYEKMLLLYFPEDKDCISAYIDNMINWHGGITSDIANAFKAIVKLSDELRYGEKDYNDTEFSEAINIVIEEVKRNDEWLHKICHNSNINTDNSSETEKMSLDNNGTNNNNTVTKKSNGAYSAKQLGVRAPKPKTKSKELLPDKSKATKSRTSAKSTSMSVNAKINHQEMLKAVAVDFVSRYYNSDPDLNNQLEIYIARWCDKGLAQSLLQAQLESLRDVCNQDAKLATLCVREAIKGSARNITTDKNVKEAKRLLLQKQQNELYNTSLTLIDKFIKEKGNNNSTLKERFMEYANVKIFPKLQFISQITEQLNRLEECCNTDVDMIRSIEKSMANGWNSVAYPNDKNTYMNNNISASMEPVDIDKKKDLINTFIEDNCYYLEPTIKDKLIEYITTTKTGQFCTAQEFNNNLNQLSLYKAYADECEASIVSAITNNYPHLCIEDKKRTNQLQMQCATYEMIRDDAIRRRRSDCVHEYFKNPNNPLLVNMPKPTDSEAFVHELTMHNRAY